MSPRDAMPVLLRGFPHPASWGSLSNDPTVSSTPRLSLGLCEGPPGGGDAVGRRLLVDTVVHQQLGDQRGEEGDGDSKPKAAS